jgi:hypothetical protein
MERSKTTKNFVPEILFALDSFLNRRTRKVKVGMRDTYNMEPHQPVFSAMGSLSVWQHHSGNKDGSEAVISSFKISFQYLHSIPWWFGNGVLNEIFL